MQREVNPITPVEVRQKAIEELAQYEKSFTPSPYNPLDKQRRKAPGGVIASIGQFPLLKEESLPLFMTSHKLIGLMLPTKIELNSQEPLTEAEIKRNRRQARNAIFSLEQRSPSPRNFLDKPLENPKLTDTDLQDVEEELASGDFPKRL